VTGSHRAYFTSLGLPPVAGLVPHYRIAHRRIVPTADNLPAKIRPARQPPERDEFLPVLSAGGDFSGGDPIMVRLLWGRRYFNNGRHIKSVIISPRADFFYGRGILMRHRHRDRCVSCGCPTCDPLSYPLIRLRFNSQPSPAVRRRQRRFRSADPNSAFDSFHGFLVQHGVDTILFCSTVVQVMA